MKLLSKQGSAAIDIDANAMNADECRLKRLIDRLPSVHAGFAPKASEVLRCGHEE